jgi:uncharacterized membrane protein YphA (DoxX/SURF4 family)
MKSRSYPFTILLTLARIFVGVLFIFSGLVKMNDPLGLSYKMQEFFEVWGWHFLNDYTLAFAILMNVFEIVAGVAVLLGWRMKLFGWLLLLLIIFFTFLTAYAAFSGKITACGCFGDCIPLKPIQSFWKDVILFVLILFLLTNYKRIRPIVSPGIAAVILIISTVVVSLLQFHVLKHLPFVDCLPYKVGNNIVEKMKIPAGAVADEFTYTFKYRKNGKVLEFPQDSLPEDLDDSYEFIERGQKLLKKGNDLKAAIADFSLQNMNGVDTTLAILNQGNKYVMLFAKEVDAANKDRYNEQLFFIVTADPESATKLFGNKYDILKCDGTVIKTAARANPTYFIMQQANVRGKYSYADENKVMDKLK